MTAPSARPRRAWWILVLLGALAVIGAAALLLSPGFRVSAASEFGRPLSIDVAPGEYAIYITPSDRWGDVRCEGVVPGDELGLRIDMMQQGLLLPERWDAKGSFLSPLAGTAHLTCDGPVEGGRFAIGPVVSFLDVAGAVLLGVLGVILAGIGLIVRAVGGRRTTP
jgi:hypothetical protein